MYLYSTHNYELQLLQLHFAITIYSLLQQEYVHCIQRNVQKIQHSVSHQNILQKENYKLYFRLYKL